MTTAQNAVQDAGQDAAQNAVPDTGPYEETYRTLFGAVPGSVRERWEFSAEHGRFTAPGLLEELRAEVIVRSPLGLKVQQLVQFAQLAALGRADAARHHALAAVRAGAGERDLLAVAETTLITSGVPGYSLALTLAREALAAADTPESSP